MKKEEKVKSVVTFVVGPYRFCIPATEVLSVITEPTMSKLPFDAGSVEGVFDHQGKVATAVSLRRKLGLEDRTGESDVWILSNITSGLTAFRVDKIIDLVDADSLHWQQIRALSPMSTVDQFAVSDKEIFLSSDCESLFAMPDMAVRIKIVDDHDVPESNETEPEMHMAGQLIEDTKPDGDSASLSIDDDTAVTGESMDREVDMESEVPMLASGKTQSIVGPDFKHDDQPLDPESSVVLQRGSNYRHNTEHGRRTCSETGKYQNHVPAKKSAIPYMQKVARRRSVKATRHAVREMRRDDYGGDSTGKKHFLGIVAVSIGILTIVAILLTAFWLWFSGKNESTHTAQSSTAFTEVIPYRNKPTIMGTEHGKSLPIPPEDGEHANNSMQSAGQSEMVPLSKTPAVDTVNYDTDEKATPHDRQKSEEVLRIETKNFTVTVERPAIPQKESHTQMMAAAYSNEEVTHIVVKGDTLWDVAEHYLGDPFRYPELAAVSHIRDPHWIYPGDIIRIIKK